MDTTFQENTSLITVFVHEMHNKLAVIRSSAGLMEFHAEKINEPIQDTLKQHIGQIHTTLDDLSSRIMELSLYMRLHLSDDDLDSETDLNKLVEQVQDWFYIEKGKRIQVTGSSGPLKIAVEHAEIVYMSVIKLALFFSSDNVNLVSIKYPFPGALQVSFPSTKFYNDDFKKIARYLDGDHKVELHSALMSIYLSNKIIRNYNGKLSIESNGNEMMSFIIQIPLA